MATNYRLTASEREFFRLAEQATLVNPFTAKRRQLNRQLSGLADDVGEFEQNRKGVQTVRERIERLERRGRDTFNRYNSEDQGILKNAGMFDFFHRFIQQFDEHIVAQLAAGAKPIAVRFANDAFAYLDQKGYTEAEKRFAFALTFQLWRAYYFIVRSLVGRSDVMRQLRQRLWNNIFTHDIAFYIRHMWNRMEDFATIITGETGTGKGTAAMAIGRSGFIPFDSQQNRFGESFAQSFVELNLSQFPETLLESELFGHKKGAFTGAVESHEGILRRCSRHGAIFLDEIGEVSHAVQIKLLKVLEERQFSPVGSHETHRFEGRIIAATNRSIAKLVKTGRMRTDFYYRLCSDVITVAPLRDRLKDDPLELVDLLTIFVTKALGAEAPQVVTDLHELIENQIGLAYSWPGNVRELAQCVRRLLLNRQYEGLPAEPTEGDTPFGLDLERGNLDAQTLVRLYCSTLYRRYGTYGEVARRTKLDRRTVKKYISDYQVSSRTKG